MTQIKNMDLEYFGRNCFTDSVTISQNLLLQLKRIAKEEGLKYREETIDEGMPGWIAATVRPIIYRRIYSDLNLKEYVEPPKDVYNPRPVLFKGKKKLKLTGFTTEDIAYFEPDHFLVKKGYESLRKKLINFYEISRVVAGCEREVKKRQEIVSKRQKIEQKEALKKTSCSSEELEKVARKKFDWFLENCFGEQREWPYWAYERNDIKEKAQSLGNMILSDMERCFSKQVDVFSENHERWAEEDQKIIIPRSFKTKTFK